MDGALAWRGGGDKKRQSKGIEITKDPLKGPGFQEWQDGKRKSAP